jgi:ABC-2 type transport system ATP-binding protein
MQRENDAVIEARNLVKSYDSRRVLDQVSLAVPRGAIVGLLGANGSGKTTLLRILLGLLPADSGDARIHGDGSRSLSEQTRARVGYVPQFSDLFGWLTGDLMLRYVGSFYPGYDADYARSLAGRLQVSLMTRIDVLSPGQQQRLSFVRALSTRPDTLILDEPMSALDPAARMAVIEELVRLRQERQITVIVSSHLIHDLERYCTHLAAMEAGKIAAFEATAHFAKMLRFTAQGPEAVLTAQLFAQAERLRVSGDGERSLVVTEDRLQALRDSLPPEVSLHSLPSDLEAVMSEWMR